VTDWRKSKRSMANGNCPEVASEAGTVLVRDSRDEAGAVLRFPAEAWRAFGADSLTAGDRSIEHGAVAH
jgi:hypothetical protein